VSFDLFFNESGKSDQIRLKNDRIATKNTSDVGFVRGFEAKGRARVPALESLPETWRLEPHVCRSCFSRLVSRSSETRLGLPRLYQCTSCGLEVAGRSPDVLCACGMKLRKATRGGRSGVVLGDAGIRCVANPEIRADFSQLYVALEVPPGA